MDSPGGRPGNTTPAKEDSSSDLMGQSLFMPAFSFKNVRFTAKRALTFEVRYSRISVSIDTFSS